MKNFFTFDHELKLLLVLEVIMVLIGILLYNSNGSIINVVLKNNNVFNIWALIISLGSWIFSCLLDTKKYFNFYTLILTVPFLYSIFWLLLTIK